MKRDLWGLITCLVSDSFHEKEDDLLDMTNMTVENEHLFTGIWDFYGISMGL